MQKIVLDASVFVKLFLDEVDSDKASDFIEETSRNGTTIIVPEVFLHEIYSVSQKSGFNLTDAYHLINNYKNTNLEIVPMDNHLTLSTIKLIEKTSNPKSGFPSFYDAVYHALAIINDCKFITADKKHYEKTKNEGFIELF